MQVAHSERLLTMSAFEAAFIIRLFRNRNPTLPDNALIELARVIRADFHSHDYEAGVMLERISGGSPESLLQDQFFRRAIEAIVENCRPVWIRLAPGGRDHVVRAIDVNGVQCFRSAGLLDAPPSKEIAEWWDRLATRIRSERSAALLEQGREAERLSLVVERSRLASLGIRREPRWIAVEDNSAGYDILSFDSGEHEPISRLIEVKSSTQTPPRIVLTRGEWNAAQQYGDAYVFHIWTFPSGTLTERKAAEIAPHIPLDQGCGAWTHVEIEIS